MEPINPDALNPDALEGVRRAQEQAQSQAGVGAGSAALLAGFHQAAAGKIFGRRAGRGQRFGWRFLGGVG